MYVPEVTVHTVHKRDFLNLRRTTTAYNDYNIKHLIMSVVEDPSPTSRPFIRFLNCSTISGPLDS